jgi:hypothetical protein
MYSHTCHNVSSQRSLHAYKVTTMLNNRRSSTSKFNGVFCNGQDDQYLSFRVGHLWSPTQFGLGPWSPMTASGRHTCGALSLSLPAYWFKHQAPGVPSPSCRPRQGPYIITCSISWQHAGDTCRHARTSVLAEIISFSYLIQRLTMFMFVLNLRSHLVQGKTRLMRRQLHTCI